MGVVIQHQQSGALLITGVGKQGLKAPKKSIDLGNSGTSIRLLTGLFAGALLNVELTGDASLVKRPMKRIVEPLTMMGATILTSEKGTAPLRIIGKNPLQGITYSMPIASAQVKSCLLLAGLYAQGTTVIIEPDVSRDHTERMLEAFGYPYEKKQLTISINSQHQLHGTQIEVPGDISSAAFFIVAATIANKAALTIKNVGVNPTRTGIITLLNKMGAKIAIQNPRTIGGEPIADLYIESAPLHGITIPEDQVSLTIDEFPALFIAAACAKGKTVLHGAEELRVKESDRIQSMAAGLQQLGIEAIPLPDGIIIEGGELKGGEVDSYEDHRIAMSFAIASVRAQAPIIIKQCENIATSFPNFVTTCQSVGLNINVS